MGLNKSSLKQKKYIINENSTCFEDLSNELIYELFDYFSFDDINLIFGNLNERFNDLINTYPHYINLQKYKSENLDLLPNNIRSLRICARYQVAFLNSLNLTSLRAISLSNLLSEQYLFIFNCIPFEQLEYIYLSICPYQFIDKQEQLKLIQEKILSLGEIKLKKCLFRMRLIADINQLSLKLFSIEYLRIDGCQNILMINNLLNHMPNLKYFRVMILESMTTNIDYSKIIRINNNLVYLVIQICDIKTPNELIPLFIQHCLNLTKLVIYLNPIGENDPVNKMSDIRFVNRDEWIMNIIQKYLSKLKYFHIRQRVCSQTSVFRFQPCYVQSYHEKLQYPPIYISIAGKVANLWKNSV